MKIKKIVAAIAAAAMAVTMTAVNAFAETITLDSDYVGAWGSGATISQEALQAIGGDVKVVCTVEVRKPLIGDPNTVVKVMDIDNGWTEIASKITSDTMIAKEDGFACFQFGQTTLEFVVPADVIATLGGNGIGFQVNDVIMKSAEISLADGPQGAITRITEDQSGAYMKGEISYEDLKGAAAPADDTAEAPANDDTAEAPANDDTAEAPANDAVTAPETTTAPATGNVAVAAIVTVMAVAGAAAIVSKKRN